MTPMDVFDSMLESIQQFPLECNHFERHIKRLKQDQMKYSTAFDKLLLKLIPPTDPKLLKVKRKLRKIRKEMIRITSNFQVVIEKQQMKLEELIKISNLDVSNFNFAPLSGHLCAVMKLGDVPQGNRKYCICNDKAFGVMICCENPACATKWHHLKCVGLQTAPKTPWTCAKCSTVK